MPECLHSVRAKSLHSGISSMVRVKVGIRPNYQMYWVMCYRWKGAYIYLPICINVIWWTFRILGMAV